MVNHNLVEGRAVLTSTREHGPTPSPYHTYLRLPDLLELQQPRSENPDELQFIVAHQAIELLFRLVLHDLRRVVDQLDNDSWHEAGTGLVRLNRTVALAVELTRSLRDLPAGSFHQFRGHLGSASGAQSTQYRQIEILSGLRDEKHLATQRKFNGGALPSVVKNAMAERSLADAHRAAGLRSGVVDWAEFWHANPGSSALHHISEQLLEYDELWLRWRTEHVVLVERMSGLSSTGTAGTDPITFLGQTLRYRFFPHLWSARATLAVRATEDKPITSNPALAPASVPGGVSW